MDDEPAARDGDARRERRDVGRRIVGDDRHVVHVLCGRHPPAVVSHVEVLDPAVRRRDGARERRSFRAVPSERLESEGAVRHQGPDGSGRAIDRAQVRTKDPGRVRRVVRGRGDEDRRAVARPNHRLVHSSEALGRAEDGRTETSIDSIEDAELETLGAGEPHGNVPAIGTRLRLDQAIDCRHQLTPEFVEERDP